MLLIRIKASHCQKWAGLIQRCAHGHGTLLYHSVLGFERIWFSASYFSTIQSTATITASTNTTSVNRTTSEMTRTEVTSTIHPNSTIHANSTEHANSTIQASSTTQASTTKNGFSNVSASVGLLFLTVSGHMWWRWMTAWSLETKHAIKSNYISKIWIMLFHCTCVCS